MFRGVSIDSRTVKPGELFIPIQGRNFDGKHFIPQARRKGAVILKTRNGLKSLQKLAAEHRQQFKIPVIGITGSSGKTTTKDMLASILSQELKVLKTEENLNNEIGVPLTLLKLKKGRQAAVIEMAMQKRGEIEELADIARPDIVIITNIGEAHLQHLKSEKNIALAKSEILKHSKFAVLPEDDKYYKLLKKKAPKNCRVIPFGITKIGKNEKFIKALPLPGRHNIYNALAAIKVAKLLKIKQSSIIKGLKSFRPSSKRMEFIKRKDKVLIINDSYNANPSSMKAALLVLASQPAKRRIAVLGGMLELGKRSRFYHEQIVNFAQKLGIDLILPVGKLYAVSRKPLADNKQAVSLLKRVIRPGDFVLIKGSRGMKMEEIVDALR